MFGDNLHFTTKKYPNFHCKNTPIVPPHSGDSLPGFFHFPRLSPKSQNTPWRQHPKFHLNQMKHNLFSYLPSSQQNHGSVSIILAGWLGLFGLMWTVYMMNQEYVMCGIRSGISQDTHLRDESTIIKHLSGRKPYR